MTIDTIHPPARRPKRPGGSRKAPARERRRRLDIRRRRRIKRSPLPIEAMSALHLLMQDGEIYQVGRRHYLVAAIDPAVVEVLVVAYAASEDDEHNGDLEPSIGERDDLEGDGLESMFGGSPISLETDAGWSDGHNQLRLSVGDSRGSADAEPDHENEHSLGWSDTTGGALGYSQTDLRASPGDREYQSDDDGAGEHLYEPTAADVRFIDAARARWIARGRR